MHGRAGEVRADVKPVEKIRADDHACCHEATGGLGGYLAIQGIATGEHEAVSLARDLLEAITVTCESDSLSEKPLYLHPLALQAYIQNLHDENRRDNVVVDRNKTILGDVIAANIGKVFDHDLANEVGRTMENGRLHTFVERSEDYRQGIQMDAKESQG